jgi:chromosome segregation ATPase
MWKILEILKKLALLTEDLTRYQADVKDLRQETRDLAISVAHLAERLDYLEKSTASRLERVEKDYESRLTNLEKSCEREHEMLMLKLENILLRFERRLPPAKPDEPEISEP